MCCRGTGLDGDRMRFHAVFRSERRLPSGNEQKELWRGRREGAAEEPQASELAQELGVEMEQQLERVISEYDAMRRSAPGLGDKHESG